MPRLIIAALIILTLQSCTVKTEPMVYGKDSCSFCKMGIIDPKYGAEIVTKKGKVYKFDDMICMASFLSGGTVTEDQAKHIVVINFEKENDFLDVNSAAFWVSPELKSPMGSNVAAFVNDDAAKKIKGERAGEIMNWKELHPRLK